MFRGFGSGLINLSDNSCNWCLSLCHSCLQNDSFPLQGITAEIDQQPDAEFRGSQIIQHLFDVRVGQFFDSFGFKKNPLPHNKISVIIVRQDNSFVRDLYVIS